MSRGFDDQKDAQNRSKHGIGFEAIAEFEWNTATTKIDNRFNYGKLRFISCGFRQGRLHLLVWTEREGKVRPISFRKANRREREDYEKDKNA